MGKLARGLVAPIVIVVLWQLASQFGWISTDAFSRPVDVAVALAGIIADGSLLLATLQTLEATAVGLILAIALGVPLGILIGTSSLANRTITPTLDMIRPIPPVALIPLSLLVFGFGVSMEAAVIAFASVWAVLLATVAGVRSLEGRLSEVARALELSRMAYVRKIVLPAALGRVLVGIRLAVGIALVVAVTVEIVVNPRGMGYGMIIAQQSLRPDLVYAQLIWIGFVGWAINWGILKLDQKYLSRFIGNRGRR